MKHDYESCPDCPVELEFVPADDENAGTGKWVCPECDWEIEESD